MTKRLHWDLSSDVVVMGSGAAGLSAALFAADAGAKVFLMERSQKFGGATAVSSGVSWVPNNHHMCEIQISDSREEALTYLMSLSLGLMDTELIETFIDHGPEVIRQIEAKSPVRFRVLKYPDYHPEFSGGKPGGRSLDAGLFDSRKLGDLADSVRDAPLIPVPVGKWDMENGISPHELIRRSKRGTFAAGNALVGGLLQGCLSHGVQVERGMRGQRLITRDGAVVGLEATRGDEVLRVEARRGVVLASGGYEWSSELCRQFLRGPMEAAGSPPYNEGDGLRMAMAVGADLGNMSESWWMTLLQIPGEKYEGRDFFRIGVVERTLPGTIMVNRRGQRFVNEAHNYNDIGRAFHTFDPVRFEFSNVPAWIIFDDHCKNTYTICGMEPGDPIPEWLPQANTLGELAERLAIDGPGLEQSATRFNSFAVDGKDPDFGRGESIYDAYNGDRSKTGPFATLAPFSQPPFYALRIYSGTIGTKGGPKTNTNAQVTNVWNEAIPGLYAAGNAMAGITGAGYGGAGATIGLALVFGYIAGRHAAGENLVPGNGH